MPISWWCALLAAALVAAYPREAFLLSEEALLRWKLWWLNRRMERMARRLYGQLDAEGQAMGLPPLPPFSWKALADRYPEG